MKPDCPYLKSKDASPSAGNGKDKVAKVKGPKSGEKDGGTPKVNEGGNPTSSRSSTFGTLSTSASTSSSPTEEKPKTVIIEDVTETASTNLMSDISGLVKSLQSLKAVQLRYVDAGGGEDPHYEGRVALLDGGATHALRQGDCSELCVIGLRHNNPLPQERLLHSAFQGEDRDHPSNEVAHRSWIQGRLECKWVHFHSSC